MKENRKRAAGKTRYTVNRSRPVAPQPERPDFQIISVDTLMTVTEEAFNAVYGPGDNIIDHMEVRTMGSEGAEVRIRVRDVIGDESMMSRQRDLIQAVVEEQGGDDQTFLDKMERSRGRDELSPEAAWFLINLATTSREIEFTDNEEIIFEMEQGGFTLEDFVMTEEEAKQREERERIANPDLINHRSLPLEMNRCDDRSYDLYWKGEMAGHLSHRYCMNPQEEPEPEYWELCISLQDQDGQTLQTRGMYLTAEDAIPDLRKWQPTRDGNPLPHEEAMELVRKLF